MIKVGAVLYFLDKETYLWILDRTKNICAVRKESEQGVGWAVKEEQGWLIQAFWTLDFLKLLWDGCLSVLRSREGTCRKEIYFLHLERPGESESSSGFCCFSNDFYSQ